MSSTPPASARPTSLRSTDRATARATAKLSVCTIVRGREAHLANLALGLAGQLVPPDELVIAYMQAEAHPLPDGLPFEVRPTFCDDDPMPLAAARNAAAEAATGDVLIFLDVDCVPSPTLVMAYALALQDTDACLMGEVFYLPEGATSGADVGTLDRAGTRHPSKPVPPETGLAPEPDYGELWGLSFALRTDTFAALGGLDERFTGYGAEETDFARKLEAASVPLMRCGGARAYHQHHAVHTPPLHHFGDIVRNAQVFRAKWGDWPMDYWLGQFERDGLIARDGARIDVLREPSPAEIVASKAPPGTLFS